MARRTSLIALIALAVSLLAAPAAADPALPPTGTNFDYQLGGTRRLPEHVGIVVRDRKAEPAADRYNICYVNGFQTQPDEKRFWRKRWRLVLKRDGEPVVDEAWGEWLLDIRTAAKRRKLARIMGRWVERCAEDGYAAVEFDNLDSWSRSQKMIDKSDAKRYAAKLVRRSHRAGLAVGQKNWAEWDGSRAGFDFAIAEECARWRECRSYADSYGRRVLVVEYRKRPFRRACRNWGDRLSVLRRDLALSKNGVRRWC